MGSYAGAKEKIINAAIPLFCKTGFKVTGIDLVLKNAGVAKMSLYYHFPSKEHLISECLNILDEKIFNSYVETITATSVDPLKQVQNALLPLRLGIKAGTFQGCPFARVSAEYPELGEVNHRRAIDHKERFHGFFKLLCTQAGFSHPDQLAYQIQVLLEGAMNGYQIYGNELCLDAAERTLSLVLGSQ